MNRILELDIIRGMVIFLMVSFDAPPDHVYDIFLHAQWEGLTIEDLVFPGFVFAMGAAVAISSSRKVISWKKILIRAGVLFLIGISLNAIVCFALYQDFANLRILGILQRLALTYVIGIAITKFIKDDKKIFATALGLLAVSSIGFHLYSPENSFDEMHNVSSAVDFIFLGVNHMLTPTHDPEGLYGTISSTSSMLFGFLAGRILIDELSRRDKILRLLIFGAILLILGGAWNYFDIIAKKLWTSPFALITSGINLIVMAILMLLSYVKLSQKIFHPFVALGKNPLFFFVALNISFIILIGSEVWGKMFNVLQNFLPNSELEFQVLIFCLIWAALWMLAAEILDRLGIVIKL